MLEIFFKISRKCRNLVKSGIIMFALITNFHILGYLHQMKPGVLVKLINSLPTKFSWKELAWLKGRWRPRIINHPLFCWLFKLNKTFQSFTISLFQSFYRSHSWNDLIETSYISKIPVSFRESTSNRHHQMPKFPYLTSLH